MSHMHVKAVLPSHILPDSDKLFHAPEEKFR